MANIIGSLAKASINRTPSKVPVIMNPDESITIVLCPANRSTFEGTASKPATTLN